MRSEEGVKTLHGEFPRAHFSLCLVVFEFHLDEVFHLDLQTEEKSSERAEQKEKEKEKENGE